MNIRFSKSQDLQLQPILTIKRVKKKNLIQKLFKKNLIIQKSSKIRLWVSVINVKLLQKMYPVVLNALSIKGY